jgi:hypothetical protein
MHGREAVSSQVCLDLLSTPAVAYIKDTYQERRELLYPGLGDPRVVNEVDHGAAPVDIGLDKDGKSLPVAGIGEGRTLRAREV